MDGWIKLWRKLLESDMYINLNAKQRDILIQCLLLANHKQRDWTWGKNIFHCNPGQFVTSLDSLRKRCSKDISIRNIRTALKELEKWYFLTNKTTKTGRLITICNWETYQNAETALNKDNDKQVTKKRQTGDKQVTTNKNVKKEKNVKNKHSELFSGKKYFEKIWERYPFKDGKKAALMHYQASVKTSGDYNRINIALNNYLESKHVKRGYIKSGPTWFENWEDWVDIKKTIFNEEKRRDEAIAKDRAFLDRMKKEKASPEVAKNKFKEIKGFLKKTKKEVTRKEVK